MSLQRTPTLPQVIEHMIMLQLSRVHTSMPGRVESYDKDLQVADVKPLLKSWFEEEGGSTAFEELEVLPHVPVYTLGGGGFRITFPIKPGDVVWLVFAERSLDPWKKLGGLQEPADRRRFHLSDAIAFAGAHSDANPWTGAPADAASMGADGGPQILFTSSGIELGASAMGRAIEAVMLGTTYRTQEDAMLSGFYTALAGIESTITAALAQLAAGVALNAVPVVGGLLAATPLTTALATLGGLIGFLEAMRTGIAAFQADAGAYLSTLVKVR